MAYSHERGSTELGVIGVTQQAVPDEGDRIRPQFVKDAPTVQQASKVGCNLNTSADLRNGLRLLVYSDGLESSLLDSHGCAEPANSGANNSDPEMR